MATMPPGYRGATGVTSPLNRQRVGYTGSSGVARGGYKTPGGQVVTSPAAPAVTMPKLTGGGGGGGGAPSVTMTQIARPSLNPLNPQAAYDPEIAKSLAGQRSYTEDLRKGTGFAMDVLTGAQADQMEAQIAQARAAAAQAGIPFDEGAMRAQLSRGMNAAMAGEKLGREQMVGGALAAESGTAQAQAGERTQRLGIDLQRAMGENAQAIDLYRADTAKYGIDVQAATAANNALLSFYSQMMGGMMGMMGRMV